MAMQVLARNQAGNKPASRRGAACMACQISLFVLTNIADWCGAVAGGVEKRAFYSWLLKYHGASPFRIRQEPVTEAPKANRRPRRGSFQAVIPNIRGA